MRDKLIALIIEAAEELNEGLEKKIPLERGQDTPLYGGEEGLIDSFGLVTLVMATEESIEDEFGYMVTLADERAMSQRNSPFLTIGTLADYIERLIQDGQNDGG